MGDKGVEQFDPGSGHQQSEATEGENTTHLEAPQQGTTICQGLLDDEQQHNKYAYVISERQREGSRQENDGDVAIVLEGSSWKHSWLISILL